MKLDWSNKAKVKRPGEPDYRFYYSSFTEAWAFIQNEVGTWEVFVDGQEDSFYLKGYGQPRKMKLDRRVVGTHPYPNNKPKTVVFYVLHKVTSHKVPDFMFSSDRKY